jgi:hypothetical protein
MHCRDTGVGSDYCGDGALGDAPDQIAPYATTHAGDTAWLSHVFSRILLFFGSRYAFECFFVRRLIGLNCRLFAFFASPAAVFFLPFPFGHEQASSLVQSP